MPSPRNWVNNTAPAVDAGWLNQVDTFIATFPSPPTTGTYNTGDFTKNSNIVLFGQPGAQYIITGWYCVQGGSPGTWMAVQLPVGGVSGVGTPAPPAPPPSTGYTYRLQAESMTGAVLASSIPGFDGTGYADWATTSGVTLTGVLPNVPSGAYDIHVRYYVYGTQKNNVVVDGNTVSPEPTYPVASPAAWQTLTLTGGVLVPPAAPTANAPSTSTSGGTLPAATYYYKVTVLTGSTQGETTPSNEVSITTTGSTSSNTVTWSAVVGATGYRIYRGTAAGAESLYYTVGAVTTFTDTNAASAAGTPPTTSTAAHTIQLVSDFGYTYYDYVEIVPTVGATPAPPAPAPPPALAPGTPPLYPFGSRLDGAYPHGLTVGQTNAAMDAVVKSAYTNWKNNRLVAVPNYTPKVGLFAGNTLYNLYADKFSTPTQTVSEGIGYSMMILVLMAGFEPNAQTYFDGMFRLARAFPATGDYLANGTLAPPSVQNYLMDWKLDITGPTSLGGGSNATDGDMDIALALFMAHRQWGSAPSTTTTQVNYYQEALNVVAAMKQVNFASNGIMYVGAQYDLSRTSDTMPFVFHVYRAATNDTFWDNSNTNSYTLLNNVITNYAATTHMPPDWIWHPLSNAPVPSPGGKIEGPYEGDYASNAVRDPLRWGHSYLFYGDTTWKGLCNNLLSWFETQAPTSGNPAQTSWAYTLSGTPLSTPNYFDPTTNAGLMIGAMCGGNAGDQAYLNACWTAHANNLQTSYYNTELQLLALIIASGNWWKPF